MKGKLISFISCSLLVTSLIGCFNKQNNIDTDDTKTVNVVDSEDENNNIPSPKEDPDPDIEIANENTTDKINEGDKRIGDGSLGYLKVKENFTESNTDINLNPSGNLMQGNTYCFKSSDDDYNVSVTNYLENDINNIAKDFKTNYTLVEDTSDISINSLDGIKFKMECNSSRNVNVYLLYSTSTIQAIFISYPKDLNGGSEYADSIANTYYIG